MFCLPAGAFLFAQTPFFKKYQLDDAFPNAAVELMYEDPNSALWFGTRKGLFLFDGLDFHPFLKTDTSSSNHVRAIYRDGSHRLWAGYQDGSIYHLEGRELQRWSPEEGTPAVPVTGFAEDAAGRLWFATYGEGVYYLDNGRMYNINTGDGLPGNDIYAIATDGKGRIWLGTDNGISICSANAEEKHIENITREQGLPDDIVHALLPDQKGNLWIGTFDGSVCYYHVADASFSYPLPDWHGGIVTSLELFEEKELWIGTEDNGLWRFSLEDQHLQSLPDWEKSKILDLHKDIEGNIWAISNDRGICSANRQFEFVPYEQDNVQAVLASRDGRIWMGSPAGLFVWQADRAGAFQQHLKKLNLNVLSLFEDQNGDLLIGTFGQGLYCYRPTTGKTRHLTEKDGLTNDNILSIDGLDGHIWLATLGGVTEVRFEHDLFSSKPVFKNFNQESGLGTNFIYKVFVDSRKRTWFGTDGKGISVLEGGTIRNYTVPTGSGEDTPFKAVYSITEDSQGHIWLSTATQGIYEFDGNKFNHLTVKEGIRDLAITSLICDANGQILIVHPSGIDLLRPENHHLIYYDEEVGIKNIDPNLNAVCKDRFGNIWAGVRKGIIRYTPLKEKLKIHPRTLINEVSVFLQPIDFQNNTTFSHDQNNLVFNYVGLWYTDPGTVKYRYQLEGYNPDWIESRDRHASYPNLPPGSYTFKVSSTENDAWLDEPVVTWSFKIQTPFWQRWWFVLLCLGCAGGFFYTYLKTRDRRRERVLLLEKEKTESELAAIKAQINPHFLFNSFNTLISVIEEDQATAVEYVEKLSDFFRSIMQLRDKEIISLQEELELVRHYGYLLEKRYGDSFQLKIHLDGEMAWIVPLALQILVENAIKHNIISKAKPLTVDIRMEDKHITVSNTLQRKTNPEQSTRFGLQSLVRRYELLSRSQVKIEETSTQFKVSIPVIE